MEYIKVETWKTTGYTSLEKKRKKVTSQNCEADNAANTINPATIKSKVEEIKGLIETTTNDLRTKINDTKEYAGSDTIDANGNNYISHVEALYTDFNLSSIESDLDNCITEADNKFNELQEENNNKAKQQSVTDCKTKGGAYNRSSSLVSSKEAF